ncbi:MAG: hypothetical protein LLF98_15155 [Clostridium sp.]|uniref:hypothetical protein n=1 Tax=Clostridium sp. TaxID=1506 RepID=UPI0025BA04A7|nr:hypothetical protein [Clostridium sp.]MCE5222526.1 hypothetical protein [Clostridium sp.]
MTEHGIYNKSLIFESKFSLEGGIEITNQIIDKCESVDAIFYSNDIIAIGGIKDLTKKRI